MTPRDGAAGARTTTHYLLHVPKTGGQTLATRLASAFPPERCSILRADIAGAEELARLAGAYDFFEGHPAGSIFGARPPGLQVIAAVRDPVEHIVSHYRHIRREPNLALHAPAAALAPTAFLERFAHIMFNFQARCLVRALQPTPPWARVLGEDLYLARSLEAAAAQVDRLLPSERIDEFCLLWSLETGRPLRETDSRVNEGAADSVDAAGLRAWLRARPERFAADLLLWAMARRRHAEWRERLIGTDRATGLPAAASLAWSGEGRGGGAGIWLTRHWHAPARRADGVVEWWAGPGMFPEIRLRTGGRGALRFEALTFLGVRWDRMRLLRRPDLAELPLRGAADPATHVVGFEANLGDAGAAAGSDGMLNLVLYAPEDVHALPKVPLAWEGPRRAFATQNWRLA